MEYFITAVTANMTIGLISGMSSTVNSIFSLSSNIAKSKSKDTNEISQLIKITNLELKIKLIKSLLNELNIDHNITNKVNIVVKSIIEAVNDINDEQIKINYRIEYNKKCWVDASKYGFNNCYKRLANNIKILDERYKLLIDMLSITQKKSINNYDFTKNSHEDDPIIYNKIE
jgi:hypothetical protein